MSYKILVIGAGAIGTYLSVNLCLQGHQIVVVERERDLPKLHQQGLILIQNHHKHQIHPVRLISDLSEIRKHEYHWGILALKTYHLRSMQDQLHAYHQNLPPLVSIQNGVESDQYLENLIGKNRLIPGTITTSIDRKGKGIAEVQKKRGIGIAQTHNLSKRIADAFQDAGLNPVLIQKAEDMKWSKLLTNLMGNATSAILSLTPKEIYQHPGLYRLELAQLRETLAVMRVLGIQAIQLPGIPVKILSNVIKYFPWQFSKMLLSRAVGGGRGGKMPSLYLDLVGKKTKSEINDLNGAVVRAADRIHLSAPVNKILTTVLLDLFSGKESRQKYLHKPEALLSKWSGRKH